MDDATLLKEPFECTEEERGDFARIVRQGFHTAAGDLDARIRAAKCLAFLYGPGKTLAAVAALKAPSEQRREDTFRKAAAGVSAADYVLELGWVFVTPARRGNHVAERLCRLLLARVPQSCVFATTRTNNDVMIRILTALGFDRVGKPYPRRDEELVLYLRPLPRLELHAERGRA